MIGSTDRSWTRPASRGCDRSSMRPLPEGEEPQQRIRYAECPTDWRARAAGLGGTAAVFLAILTGLTFTWHMVQPLVAPPAPVVVNLQSFEAPPEPVREVPEGHQDAGNYFLVPPAG